MNIMNLEEYKGVYVFAEQVDNKLSGIAFELLGKAKDLAADLNAEVAAVLIGSDVKGLADELAAYGADKVIVVDDPELKEYRTEPYAHALASVIIIMLKYSWTMVWEISRMLILWSARYVHTFAMMPTVSFPTTVIITLSMEIFLLVLCLPRILI